MNAQGIDEIERLLKEYALQEHEVYINRTIPAIGKLEGIAYDLAYAYEMEYRANPTYEHEERMRYWRYMRAKHWSSKADGTYYEGPNTECILRKREYDELIRKHKEAQRAEAIKYANEKCHENPNASGGKNIPAFIGLLGLTVGINVLVHILFALAS